LKQSGKRGGCGRLRGETSRSGRSDGLSNHANNQQPGGHGDGGGTTSTVSYYRAVLQKLFILRTRLSAPKYPTEAANNASCIAAFATRVTTPSPPIRVQTYE
ncbi:hypothetical protein J3459_018660, partial [Metarhizium acridum]